MLVGYSQGGQIMDDALCGGDGLGTSALDAAALAQVKAAIFMGDPHFLSGLSYEVGTCKAGGVSFSSFFFFAFFACCLLLVCVCVWDGKCADECVCDCCVVCRSPRWLHVCERGLDPVVL